MYKISLIKCSFLALFVFGVIIKFCDGKTLKKISKKGTATFETIKYKGGLTESQLIDERLAKDEGKAIKSRQQLFKENMGLFEEGEERIIKKKEEIENATNEKERKKLELELKKLETDYNYVREHMTKMRESVEQYEAPKLLKKLIRPSVVKSAIMSVGGTGASATTLTTVGAAGTALTGTEFANITEFSSLDEQFLEAIDRDDEVSLEVSGEEFKEKVISEKNHVQKCLIFKPNKFKAKKLKHPQHY